MDGESEPNPAVAEKAGERVEPTDATPSPKKQQQQTTPPSSKELEDAVSMETEDGATKEGGGEDNDDDVVLVEEPPLAAALPQDTPSTDCLKLPAAAAAAAAVATADMSTSAAAVTRIPSPPAFSSASTATAAPPVAEPIIIDDEEDSEQKDATSTAPPGGSSASHSPGALSSTEPDSEIRIASVTTLGEKGSSAVATVNTLPHPTEIEGDMNLMITSVTSLQGGAAAVTAVRINTTDFMHFFLFTFILPFLFLVYLFGFQCVYFFVKRHSREQVFSLP